MLEKIKIAGIKYDVIFKKFDAQNDGSIPWGICNTTTCEISLEESLNKDRQDQTLIHEILHAIFEEAGVTLEDEEPIVNNVGKVLYQVLKDNDFSWIGENSKPLKGGGVN